ncbi:hypothetical protein EYF80_008475 [Liparis tanakae]|uniref:Uncharacterized protein n=1 Tax=Liparis tanakae TaxID=230148 RepID=A0A4Z2ITT0_9TELE|nr:hypothetical protein EYF80_008475 [Liparis tanakae]
MTSCSNRKTLLSFALDGKPLSGSLTEKQRSSGLQQRGAVLAQQGPAEQRDKALLLARGGAAAAAAVGCTALHLPLELRLQVFNVYFSVVKFWLSSHIWLFRLVSSQLIGSASRSDPARCSPQQRVILSLRVA